MKNRNPDLLSFKTIDRNDLMRLLNIAQQDRHAFFMAHPDWREYYKDRVMAVALCQGAAKHYLDPTYGINDFDVYTFYATHPSRRWYAKRLKSVDFGDPKFGRSEISPTNFVGRRVDLMGRGLDVEPGAEPIKALCDWVTSSKARTVKEIVDKPIILLEPVNLLGVIAWGGQT